MALFVCFGASTRETLKPYTYRPSVVLNGVGNIAAIARVRSHKIAAFPNLFAINQGRLYSCQKPTNVKKKLDS